MITPTTLTTLTTLSPENISQGSIPVQYQHCKMRGCENKVIPLQDLKNEDYQSKDFCSKICEDRVKYDF